MRALLVIFLAIFAQASGYIHIKEPSFPKRLYTNQVFPLNIKFLTKKDAGYDLRFELEGGKDTEFISDTPVEHKGLYATKSLYFKILAKKARLPKITIHYSENNHTLASKVIPSLPIKSTALNGAQNFSGLIAKQFEVVSADSNIYDDNSNLITFSFKTLMGNWQDFKLNGVLQQGIKSSNSEGIQSDLIYYAIVPSHLDRLSFSYFDLGLNNFKRMHLDIKLVDRRVSTQSELNPQDSSFKIFQILFVSFFLAIFLLLALFKRKIIYVVLTLIPTLGLVYILLPIQSVCIKQGALVSVLPTQNSTTFIKIAEETKAKKITTSKNFTKIKLKGGRVGWIKNENICKDK